MPSLTKLAGLALVLAGGVALAGSALPGSAQAGECPADQVQANALTSGETKPKGVTDDVLSTIDLSSKGEAWKGQMFRFRKLVVKPGGIVPWHAHDVRPANILIVEGAITEYRSDCKKPVVHKAGDAVAEFDGLAHWWKNNTRKRAVLYSADILPPSAEPTDSMM